MLVFTSQCTFCIHTLRHTHTMPPKKVWTAPFSSVQLIITQKQHKVKIVFLAKFAYEIRNTVSPIQFDIIIYVEQMLFKFQSVPFCVKWFSVSFFVFSLKFNFSFYSCVIQIRCRIVKSHLVIGCVSFFILFVIANDIICNVFALLLAFYFCQQHATGM